MKLPHEPNSNYCCLSEGPSCGVNRGVSVRSCIKSISRFILIVKLATRHSVRGHKKYDVGQNDKKDRQEPAAQTTTTHLV